MLVLQVLGNAASGVNGLNVELANLGIALAQTAVLISAFIIATSVGGQGIQKPVRQAAMTIGIVALFLKGYQGLVTGTMGLF